MRVPQHRIDVRTCRWGPMLMGAVVTARDLLLFSSVARHSPGIGNIDGRGVAETGPSAERICLSGSQVRESVPFLPKNRSHILRWLA
jgi:hypothetical protein